MGKTKAQRAREAAARAETATVDQAVEPAAEIPAAINPVVASHLGCEACRTIVEAGGDLAGQQAVWFEEWQETCRRYAYDSGRLEDSKVLLAGNDAYLVY